MLKLAVIGAGPAGYNAALYASSLGLSTVLIEKEALGGTCLNLGCIPTKSLLQSASVFQTAKNCDTFGILSGEVSYDLEKMYARKNQVVEKLKKGIEYLIKKSSLDFVYGQAEFLDSNTLKVGDKIIKAENILIATGSRPTSLPINGKEFAIDSDKVLTDSVTENDIVIVGGGVIGVEFASFFSALGKNVTIIECAERILPYFDIDAANALTMALKRNKVKILTNAKVLKIEKNDDLTAFVKVGQEEIKYTCQKVIICAGRQANIESLQLDRANVLHDKSIFVDENFATNIPNIYCVGDAIGKIQLAHMAEAQGIVAVDKIVGKPASINLNIVPNVVYSTPEIAVVGKIISQDEKLYTSKVFMTANGKASVENQTSGFVKIAANADGVIVGATLVNSRASELIGELSLAITNRLTVDDIIKTIHPHPTLSEAIRLCAAEAKKLI
ncbi:MAG: dihydrolipoyl dehydrogenase [Clostridiales bacterium]|nr:dihydrolipoyl dehydrogenase [Clostridiales bacterium]